MAAVGQLHPRHQAGRDEPPGDQCQVRDGHRDNCNIAGTTGPQAAAEASEGDRHLSGEKMLSTHLLHILLQK